MGGMPENLGPSFKIVRGDVRVCCRTLELGLNTMVSDTRVLVGEVIQNIPALYSLSYSLEAKKGVLQILGFFKGLDPCLYFNYEEIKTKRGHLLYPGSHGR